MSAPSPRRRSPQPPHDRRVDASCSGIQGFDLVIDATDAVLRAVEVDIIPRMARRHSRPERPAERAVAGAMQVISQQQVHGFADRLLVADDSALVTLQQLVDQGTDPTSLCLELLAPAARRLGDLWSEDLCDFAQVTIGLGRLHGMLRLLAHRLPLLPGPTGVQRRAVFAPTPNEQHTLGLCMVADFFRSANWDVWPDMPTSPQAMLSLLAGRVFHLVGFSIGHERQVPELSRFIAQVRLASADPGIVVMVGGPLLLDKPECFASLGADAMASDARQAILEAERLVTAQGKVG